MLDIRPTWLKHYRLTFDVSEFAKTLAACFPEVLPFSGDERKDADVRRSDTPRPASPDQR
jgi:hypothetical protein